MVPGSYSLSKTSFLKLEQCHKAFFLYRNHPYLRDKPGTDKQLTFKRGHDVGFFAQQLFPGGIDVSKESGNIRQTVENTAELIKMGHPVIYEASFIHNGVLIMVDILVKENEQYLAYEVKSSLRISETYLKDAYLQYYVLKNILPGFEDLFLVSLNPDYIRGEEIEPKKLFRRRSVKQKAEENFSYFDYQINKARELIERNAIPDISVGKQCFKPYQCDFFGSCWKNDLNDQSIFALPLIDRTKLFEWHSSGLKTISQLTDEMIEKPRLLMIRDAILNNEPIVDKKAIGHFLDHIRYPVVAMDMEIWSPAIPQVKGTKCFEQLPFLVSFFDGTNARHYFSDYESDERVNFARALIDATASYSTILVYDRNLELNIINALTKMFPQLKEALENVKNKIIDIFDVFVGLQFYHPLFRNNFSLKAVSSVLLKDITYSRIGSGLEAMNYFEQFRAETGDLEREAIKADLMEYCETDCRATLGLLEFLKQL